MRTRYRNIARVVKPHGTKGEVVVVALRGLPFLLEEGMRVALTPPALGRERFSTVVESDGTYEDESALVRFSCADNLDDASALSGCFVLADDADLDLGPLTAPIDEIVGREVVDERYGVLGTITEVILAPANDAWVIDVPYGELIIPVVDSVVLDLPETGAVSVAVPGGIVPDEAGSTGENA